MPFHAYSEATISREAAIEAARDWSSSNTGDGAARWFVSQENLDQRELNKWRSQYALVRTKLTEGLDLKKQYLELPIQVRHAYEGYPQVDAALIQLEAGWFQDACLLFDCCYTDDRVAACLNTRGNGLFSLELEFKYQGEEEDSEEDEDIVALKKGVRDITKEYWDEMLPLSAIREWFLFGIGVNLGVGELVWDFHPMQMRFDDSPQLQKMDEIFLPIMKTWNPQTCYWRWDTRSFWMVHQSGQTELNPGDGRWVTYSPAGHVHGWLYGVVRQLGKLWLDRVFTYRDWARAEEKYSLGIIKAFEPAGASPADKLRFEQQTQQMPPEATITLPRLAQGVEFDLEMMETAQVSSGWEIFERRADNLNRCIAVLLLGQNLTTESQKGGGSGGGGGGQGRGNSQVQDNVRKDYLKADANSVQHALKTQVLAQFVKQNFEWAANELGISWRELVPNVRWIVEPPKDKFQEAQSVNSAATALAALKTAMVAVDDEAFCEKFEIPYSGDELTQAAYNIGDGNERPRAPMMYPSADPDPRPVALARKAPPPALKPSGKEGQLFVDRIRQIGSEKAAKLMTAHRDAVLEICRASTSYREKKQALAALFKISDAGELRKLVRHAIVASRFAGRLSVQLGRE